MTLPLTAYLGKFVHDVFDHNRAQQRSFWPELEDVFTNIDLAANTGRRSTYHTDCNVQLSQSARFPDVRTIWLSAEQLLRQAKKWIFIGYSLPAADYQFKRLLKRVQLSREIAAQFVAVTGGKKINTDATYRNYQGFFGRDIRRKNNGGKTSLRVVLRPRH